MTVFGCEMVKKSKLSIRHDENIRIDMLKSAFNKGMMCNDDDYITTSTEDIHGNVTDEVEHRVRTATLCAAELSLNYEDATKIWMIMFHCFAENLAPITHPKIVELYLNMWDDFMDVLRTIKKRKSGKEPTKLSAKKDKLLNNRKAKMYIVTAVELMCKLPTCRIFFSSTIATLADIKVRDVEKCPEMGFEDIKEFFMRKKDAAEIGRAFERKMSKLGFANCRKIKMVRNMIVFILNQRREDAMRAFMILWLMIP